MPKKVTDLKKARQEKREKSGWSLEEIKKRAAEERAAYRRLAKDEPDALASGKGMSSTSEEEDSGRED